MRSSRRSVMRGLGALGAVGCGPAGSPPPKPVWVPPATRVDHLVLVMMENRSFDHYFGALSLVEGRAEVDGLLPGMSNPSPLGGIVTPAPLREWCVPDPPHGWDSSHAQFAAGLNNGFAEQYHASTGSDPAWALGYHDRSVLPVTYALSDAYVTCQRWFASVMGPTWPNRLFVHCGENQGMTGNDLPDDMPYTARTLYDQLDEAGLSWSYYYSDAPFIAVLGDILLRDEVRPIDEFYADAAAGTLPSVSIVEPAFSFNDDHPPHHPLLGQLFLASVHNALARSPAWGRTMLVITYDEHGGFHDHVPPPKTVDDRAAEGFDQLGFRVPTLVCGPWMKAGHVSDVVHDHTSWLKTVQERFGLESLTTRNAAANDLTDAFDDALDVERAPAELPVIALTEEEIFAQCEDPTARRSLHQPELEPLLDGLPRRLDRRAELDRVARDAIVRAEELGALRIL